jgi:hypothetical protein
MPDVGDWPALVRTCPDCGALAGDNWRCEYRFCMTYGTRPAPADIGTPREEWNEIAVVPLADAVARVEGVVQPDDAQPGFLTGIRSAAAALSSWRFDPT